MPSCKRGTRKKYQNRPSPGFPAQECKFLIKKGNDGNKWQSLPARNGVFRWKRIPQASRRR